MAEQTEKSELLSQFQAKVDEFARFQEFIAKAEAQASRFAPEVVEKVISSNREKSMAVVEDLIPLTADVEDTLNGLTSERDGISESTKDSEMAMQELELRQMIGEIDQEGFEAEAAELKGGLDEARERIEALGAEIDSYQEALDRWTELGTAAGVLAEPEPEPEPELELEPQLVEFEDDEESEDDGMDVEDDLIAIDGPSDDDDDEEPGHPTIQIQAPASASVSVLEEDDFDLGGDVDDIVEIVMDEDDEEHEIEIDEVDVDLGGDGVHVKHMQVQDDVSVVFEESDDHDTKQEEILLADEVLPEDDGDLDILGEDEPLELDAADGGGEIKPRRAVLLYAEGTPEEQVHPVTKDVVSIGRGRDNDIQVRNDSKVSRYHCKIYRRGPNYYIEDNKSANGSLVNGELITERRLFGGEEIIIGETFFRFRILD